VLKEKYSEYAGCVKVIVGPFKEDLAINVGMD
jgi:hypothetical protein